MVVKNPDEELSKKIKENFRYDPETGELFKLVEGEWSLLVRGKNNPYVVTGLCGRSLLGHRVSWFLYYGVWPEESLDHINHIKDDNRIVNLREATDEDQNRNHPLSVTNTSGCKGVYWHKDTSRWLAKIWEGGRAGGWVHLGCFKEYDEAVAARKNAEKERGFHKNHGKPKG